MKKQSNPLAAIPVNYVCVSIDRYGSLLTSLQYAQREVAEAEINRSEMIDQLAEYKTKISELSKKLSDTEEELSRENDSKLYWYKKFMELSDKIEREKEATDAATEAT